MKKIIIGIVISLLILFVILLLSTGGPRTELNKYADYKKVSTLHSDIALTTMLFRYEDILFGKSFSLIDYAPNPEGPIGKIDKLIDSEYVPKYNGETNTEELLNAEVDSIGQNSIVLKYNNTYGLYEKIEE